MLRRTDMALEVREIGALVAQHSRFVQDVIQAMERVIVGQKSMLERLLQNLVLNALEASPDDQIVSIEAASVRAGEASIAVLDSGRGMPAQDLVDLLRFGRSGSSGSGIGWTSAEACARALGAKLEIRSRLGEGTAVRFRIRSLDPSI